MPSPARVRQANSGPSPEVIHERVQQGAEAEQLLSVLDPFLRERRDQIIHEAVAWFRGNEIQSEKTAVRYIAALSEIDAQLEELKYRQRLGAQAKDTLLSTTDPE